jgi:hypothetical protein
MRLVLATWGGVLFVIMLTVLLWRRARRHGGAMRGGVIAAMEEMHSADAQKALEVIVEGQAEARRPEYPDGNLPDLESPGGRDDRKRAARSTG